MSEVELRDSIQLFRKMIKGEDKRFSKWVDDEGGI